jgi:hypothetical protein
LRNDQQPVVMTFRNIKNKITVMCRIILDIINVCYASHLYYLVLF